jgi:hypothetical protein
LVVSFMRLRRTHDFIRTMPFSQQLRHSLHSWIDVHKEMLSPSAEMIQSLLSIRRLDEAAFRTFTEAGEKDRTFKAILRKLRKLVAPELALLIGIDRFPI